MTKRGELPILPPEVAQELKVIQLFVTYLRQRTTTDALMAMAKKEERFDEIYSFHHSITILSGAPRSREDLRRLLKFAPALDAIVSFVRALPSHILPEEAIPSERCIQGALAAYHQWVRVQARRR